MHASSRFIAPEDILRLSSGDKSRFMHDALTEAHMYGMPDVRQWLNERYGLTRDQTLELALDILTANGSQPLSNLLTYVLRRGLRRDWSDDVSALCDVRTGVRG